MLKNVALLTECSRYTHSDVIFSLEFLHGNYWNFTAWTHHTPKTIPPPHKEDFLHSHTGSSKNSPLHITKTRLHKTRTLSVDQYQSCTDWRNWLQKCILATGSYSFKAWTTVALHGRTFVALHADVSETFVSWDEKFSVTFSSRLKYSCIKNTCYWTVYLSWGTLLHQWRIDKWI
jgi:hypothetical protein